MWRIVLLACLAVLHVHCTESSADTVSKRVELLRVEAQRMLVPFDGVSTEGNLKRVVQTIRSSSGIPFRTKEEVVRHSMQLAPALALVQEQSEVGIGSDAVCDEVDPQEVEVSEDEWFVIAVHFNIIRPDKDEDDCFEDGCSVKGEDVRHMIDVMNNAYRPAQIAFYLHGISRHAVESGLYQALSGGTGEVLLKHRYSKDPSRVLNIYITDFRSVNGADVVGVATFPYAIDTASERESLTADLTLTAERGSLDQELLADLVSKYVSTTTTTGSMGGDSGKHQVSFGWGPRSFMQGILLLRDFASKGGGKVLVHETGHYLGLHHTFYGGCDSVHGDCVDDTPPTTLEAQVFSWQMCRNSKPYTCPDLRVKAGEAKGADDGPSHAASWRDPVHNYMSYSDVACTHEFSAGQITRMRLMYKRYRSVDWAALAEEDTEGEDDFTVAFIEAARALCGDDAGCRLTSSSVQRVHSLAAQRWRNGVREELEAVIDNYWQETQRIRDAHQARARTTSFRPAAPRGRRRPPRRGGAGSSSSSTISTKSVHALRDASTKKADASALDADFKTSVLGLPSVMTEFEVMWPEATVEQVARAMVERRAGSSSLVGSAPVLDVDTKEWIENVGIWKDTRRVLNDIAKGNPVSMDELEKLMRGGGLVFPHDRDTMNAYDMRVKSTEAAGPNIMISKESVRDFEYLHPNKQFLAQIAGLVSKNSVSAAFTLVSAGARHVFMMIEELLNGGRLDTTGHVMLEEVVDGCVGHETQCRLLLLIVNQWLTWNGKMADIKRLDESKIPRESSLEPFVLLVAHHMENTALSSELKAIADEVARIKAGENAASIADVLTSLHNQCNQSWRNSIQWNSQRLFEVAAKALLDAHWNRVEGCAESEGTGSACNAAEVKGILEFSQQLLESADPMLGQHIYDKGQYMRSAEFLNRAPRLFKALATLYAQDTGLGYGLAMDAILSWEVGLTDTNGIGPVVVYATQTERGGGLQTMPCVRGDAGCVVLLSLVGGNELDCSDLDRARAELDALSADEGGARATLIWGTAVRFFQCAREGTCHSAAEAVQVLHTNSIEYLASLHATFATCHPRGTTDSADTRGIVG